MISISFSQENVNIEYLDSNINKLITISKFKKAENKISVYSIQLKSSEKPDVITFVKKKYNKLFPSETIDEVFEPPYFKAITGSYLDKKIAEKKLEKIQNKFKSAFILKRPISIEKFKANHK